MNPRNWWQVHDQLLTFAGGGAADVDVDVNINITNADHNNRYKVHSPTFLEVDATQSRDT
jgi:hypothetical protein